MPKSRLKQKPNIFLSYNHNDFKIATRLHCILEELGLEVWMDKHDIDASNMWRRDIHKALKATTHLLYLHSANAFDSDRVWEEWDYYLYLKKPVIPLILDDTELPYPFVSIQHITFNEEQLNQTIQKILAALGVDFPVPPDGPDDDPTNPGKRPIREHIQEDAERNYSFASINDSTQDGNSNPKLYHLLIIPIRQAKVINFVQARDKQRSMSTDNWHNNTDKSNPDNHSNLRDAVRKQIEEIVDRADRQGVGILPSDLKHLEFNPSKGRTTPTTDTSQEADATEETDTEVDRDAIQFISDTHINGHIPITNRTVPISDVTCDEFVIVITPEGTVREPDADSDGVDDNVDVCPQYSVGYDEFAIVTEYPTPTPTLETTAIPISSIRTRDSYHETMQLTQPDIATTHIVDSMGNDVVMEAIELVVDDLERDIQVEYPYQALNSFLCPN